MVSSAGVSLEGHVSLPQPIHISDILRSLTILRLELLMKSETKIHIEFCPLVPGSISRNFLLDHPINS